MVLPWMTGGQVDGGDDVKCNFANHGGGGAIAGDREIYSKCFLESFQGYNDLLDGRHIVVPTSDIAGTAERPRSCTEETSTPVGEQSDLLIGERLYFRFNMKKVHKLVALFVVKYVTVAGYTEGTNGLGLFNGDLTDIGKCRRRSVRRPPPSDLP
eukprot:GHVS01084982.1.p1 GENE.GHVS01084982.1~~GHVS01084982.1.p1  ORF type:complete len:155 (-),score=21.29 GHVS01084982.1:72-536(-)